MAKKN